MAETPQEERICFDSLRTPHICSTKWVDSKVEVEGEDTGVRTQSLQRVLCRNFGLINLEELDKNYERDMYLASGQGLSGTVGGQIASEPRFFVDVSLFDDLDHCEKLQSVVEQESYVEDDALADEAEHLMLKLKFLTYKLRTFLIRNGLSTLFDSGFAAYKNYYLKQMDKWGTSSSKRQQLDQLLTEWAGYITHKCKGIQLDERSYLSEAEPFLRQFAEKSLRNRQLVGAAGSTVKTEDLLSRLSVTELEDDLSEDVSKADLVSKEPTKAKGLLIFFPGIPGCAKSALCRALLEVPGGLGTGKPMHSLMGDMTKVMFINMRSRAPSDDSYRVSQKEDEASILETRSFSASEEEDKSTKKKRSLK
ncbi:hypothetical protein L7F22_038688 [Adiantum nelumboides]|nr:hypothetical protein [Adiantum nelumboides]